MSSRIIHRLLLITVLAFLGSTALGAASPNEVLPSFFEAHPGQGPAGAGFLARFPAYTARIDSQRLVLQPVNDRTPLSIELVGARADAPIRGVEPLATRVSYYLGNDPAAWRRNLETFSRLRQEEVYPGIARELYGKDRQLEYDFIIAPGVDPAQIRLRFVGVEPRLRSDGGLDVGGFVQHAPRAYQTSPAGPRAVASRYALRDGEVGFELGDYDRALPLVIDPVLVYSTYLGGEGEDVGQGIALDGQRNAYVVGYAATTSFPTDDPLTPDTTHAGGGTRDAFVAKVDPTGTELIYLTFLGGGNQDTGFSIVANPGGEVWVAGITRSNDFPATPGAFQTAHAGVTDVFLARLDTDGSLAAATFLGGMRSDAVERASLDLDDAGALYVVGSTTSQNFPILSAFQPAKNGAAASSDAFVAKLSADLSGLVYSTYFGGTGNECQPARGCSVAVDAAGRAHLGGNTESNDLPMMGGFDLGFNGGSDVFVAVFGPNGDQLDYSTYIGGSLTELLGALDLGSDGSIHLVGQTHSADFPVTADAYQPVKSGDPDVFVVRLDVAAAPADQLRYGTFLGGTGQDRGFAIAVDTGGSVHVSGFVGSADFPLVDPIVPDLDDSNAFIARFDPEGRLAFSSHFGGSSGDNGYAVAVDPMGAVYLTGVTESPDFPLAPEDEAIQSSPGTAFDGIVAKIGRDVVENPRFEYTAKILCGVQADPADTRLAPGSYSTVVNIHSPNRRPVEFFKKLALAYPPGDQQPGEILPIAVDQLEYDEALAVDCPDLVNRLFPDGLPAPYIDGFLVIQSNHSLDVTTVYTTAAIDDRGQPTTHSSIDVEQVRERAQQPGADLVIRKTALVEGTGTTMVVHYTIEVDNLGPSAAPNVVVNDLLQAEIGSLVNIIPASLSVSHGGVWVLGPFAAAATTLQATIPLLPAGDTAVLEFAVVVTIDPPTFGVRLVDTAQVTSALPDPDFTNNQVVLVSNFP